MLHNCCRVNNTHFSHCRIGINHCILSNISALPQSGIPCNHSAFIYYNRQGVADLLQSSVQLSPYIRSAHKAYRYKCIANPLVIQLLQIIVSRNLASDPSFPYVLEGVLSTLRIRQSASLAVARHSAAEIIENQQAFLGVRLSTDIQTTLDVFSEGGSVPESQLGQVQRLMDGAWRTAVVPYVGLNESGMQNPDSAAGRPLDGVAGSLAYEGENEVEYLGAVLLGRTGMVGELTGMEMRFLAFVQGSMKQFIFRVDDAYYLVEQNFRPRLRVSRSGEAWTLQVEGGITAYPRSRERVGETRVSEAFAAEVLHVLEKLRDLGVDPVGFEGIAVRSSPTLDAWAQEGWERQYRDSSIEVSIRATVHYGN